MLFDVIFMFMVPSIVYLCFNKPTRCNCSQSILFYCRVTLHVSGVFHTHHQEYTKLNHSVRYRSYCNVRRYFNCKNDNKIYCS